MLRKELWLSSRRLSRLIWRPSYRQFAAKPLSPTAWIDAFFEDNCLSSCVLSVSAMKEANGKSCIINDPHDTMKNTYLGDHLTRCVKSLKDVAATAPSTRQKPVVVTVRGTGGGKTRLLEELRRLMNQDSHAVALSITFNNNTRYAFSDETFLPGDEHIKLNIVLSILLRITATVYDISFGDILERFLAVRSSLDIQRLITNGRIVSFSRYFIQRIFRDIDASSRHGETFICLRDVYLFIDEIMVIKDHLVAHARDKKNYFEDAVAIVRQTLLDERFYGCQDDSPVNVCLSISSLEISISGKSDSGRDVEVLIIPELLDAEDIVRLWWTDHLDGLHEVDAFRLKLVAETVNMQPRVVSYVSDFIKRQTREGVSASKPFVDAAFVKSMYEYVLVKMKRRYSFTTIEADPSKLMSLVFGEFVQLDAASATMIRQSIYTNSLKETIRHAKIRPNGSLLMLTASAEVPPDSDDNVDLLNPFKCFKKLYDRTIEGITNERGKEGATLESLTEWWLKCRIAVSVTAGIKSIPLERLLPVISSADDSIISVPLPSKDYVKHPDWPALTRANVTEFATIFNSNTGSLTSSDPFVMYKSCERQGFDQLISFMITEPDKPVDSERVSRKAFLVFLDEKSRAVRIEKAQSASSKQTGSAYSDSDQFRRVQLVAKELKRLRDEEELKLSEESEALVAGRYRFVYMTTHEKVNLKDIDPKVLACDEAGAKKFFGFMWPFVRASRGPSSM